MEASNSREQPPDCSRAAKDSAGDREEPGRTAEGARNATDEVRRRKIHPVTHIEGLVGGRWRRENRTQCRHGVLDVGEAPSVADRSERERRACFNGSEQEIHVRLHAGAVDDGKTQDRRMKSLASCDHSDQALGLELAFAIRVTWLRRCVGTKHDVTFSRYSFYRAREHEASHTGGHRLFEEK